MKFRIGFNSFRVLLVLIVLTAFLLVGSGVAFAQGSEPPPVGDSFLPTLLAQLATLAGSGALVSLIVNILKVFGVVKDGTAANWVTFFNLLLLIALFVLKVFRPDIDVLKLDGVAATIAQIGVLLLGFVTQISASYVTYARVRGVWLVGKTLSIKPGA